MLSLELCIALVLNLVPLVTFIAQPHSIFILFSIAPLPLFFKRRLSLYYLICFVFPLMLIFVCVYLVGEDFNNSLRTKIALLGYSQGHWQIMLSPVWQCSSINIAER